MLRNEARHDKLALDLLLSSLSLNQPDSHKVDDDSGMDYVLTEKSWLDGFASRRSYVEDPEL